MTAGAAGSALALRVAHATRPRDGEVVNGDAVIVRRAGRWTLFGVIDGLGHGPAAALASGRMRDYLETADLELGIESLFLTAHRVLADTRGVAATVCLFDGAKLAGSGVGNVELRRLDRSFPALLTVGVLGHRLQRLRVFEAPLAAGDRLALFSDGISSRFDLAATREAPPERACETILTSIARTHDDATIMIVDVSRADPALP